MILIVYGGFVLNQKMRRVHVVARIHASPSVQRRWAPAGAGGSKGYVQAFLRQMHKPSVPTVGPGGESIDRDKLLFEWSQLVDNLKTTTLVEHIHLMDPFPSFESVSPADTIFAMKEYIVQLPAGGREHRAAERNDILKFARGLGAHGAIGNLFEDRPEFRLHGMDLVALPESVIVGLCDSRTNLAGVEKLKDVKYAGTLERIPTHAIDIGVGSPTLATFFGFGGDSTLLAWDTPLGNKVLDYTVANDNSRAWNFVKLRPGCNFFCVATPTPRFDVLVDEADEESIASLMQSPLNPVPTPWTEMKKAGISMRSTILVLMFSRGGFGAGGFQAHNASAQSRPRLHKVNIRQRPKIRGDNGAPLRALLESWEMPEVVYQPPPRYRPPMHSQAGLTPYHGSPS